MSIAVIAESDDYHAKAVLSALEAFNVPCLKLQADKLPGSLEISYGVDKNGSFSEVDNISLEKFDTVWLRRRGIPKSVPDDIREDEKAIALQESKEFWKALLQAIAPQARWVNPMMAKDRAQSKLLQLSIARNVGLTVPRTLVSNNPTKIKQFLSDRSGYIFKSLTPVSWVEEAYRVQALYTSRVSIEDLPDDTALRAAPGIFQQAIPKKIEVRATFLGKKCITAKIDSSVDGRSHQDWRLGYYSGLKVEPYKLPDEVEALAMKFMEEIGLQYAAFDFILSEDGQWYFLEANESGQFLWIEQYNPDIPMLKSFCDFLVGNSSWSPNFSLAEFDGNVANENASGRLKIIA